MGSVSGRAHLLHEVGCGLIGYAQAPFLHNDFLFRRESGFIEGQIGHTVGFEFKQQVEVWGRSRLEVHRLVIAGKGVVHAAFFLH